MICKGSCDPIKSSHQMFFWDRILLILSSDLLQWSHWSSWSILFLPNVHMEFFWIFNYYIFENHRFILTPKLFLFHSETGHVGPIEGALVSSHNVEGHVNWIDRWLLWLFSAWLLIMSMFSDRWHLWLVIDQGILLIFRSYFYPTFNEFLMNFYLLYFRESQVYSDIGPLWPSFFS